MITAEEIANVVLHAAGSGLRNYTPHSKQRIIEATESVVGPLLALTADNAKLREAVANYMRSEGCSCCQGSDHDEHKAVLATLLNVPQYDDGSGYDFFRFCSVTDTLKPKP